MKRCEVKEDAKWNLEYFFKNTEEYKNSILKTEELLKELVSMKGSLTKDKENFYKFLTLDDEIEKKLENIYVYSYLNHYSDTNDESGKKLKNQADKLEEKVANETSFIRSELLSNDYDYILNLMAGDKRFDEYRFSIEKMFRYKNHTLSEAEERIISLASNALGTPDNAFSALDNADVNFGKITIDGEEVELTHSNYIKLIGHKNQNTRKRVFEQYYKYYVDHKETIAELYKGQVKQDIFYSTIRKYHSPLEASLYGDNINVEVYKNLINTIHENLKPIYEYMKVRKDYMGVKELHMYDIYTDLIKEDPKTFTYEEAKAKVLEALKPLGDTYIKDLKNIFDSSRVDVYPNDGKRSGAYQWGSYYAGPFVSTNFDGTEDSVSTIAHELGHAMHSFYSKKNQCHTNANYPIFLAEIASTVNEVLLSEYNIKNAQNDTEKLLYLTDFLDKFRATVYRQTMFAEFEMLIHDMEQKGKALTSETLYQTYYNLNKLYYGDNVISDKLIGYEWSRIPHFYTPFYVYKYATGFMAAVSIATDILNNKPQSLENYLNFLGSGCSKYPLDTLKACNVDMTTKEPIEKSIELFKNRLKMVEEIIKKEEEYGKK